MAKVKCLHQKSVNIPVQGGRIDFKPGEEKEIDDEIAKKLIGRKGFEVDLLKEKEKKSKKKDILKIEDSGIGGA